MSWAVSSHSMTADPDVTWQTTLESSVPALLNTRMLNTLCETAGSSPLSRFYSLQVTPATLQYKVIRVNNKMDLVQQRGEDIMA